LDRRRSRGDIQCEIITGRIVLQFQRLFGLTRSKCHWYKLFCNAKGILEKKSFSVRVVEFWDGLDDSAVSVETHSSRRKV